MTEEIDLITIRDRYLYLLEALQKPKDLGIDYGALTIEKQKINFTYSKIAEEFRSIYNKFSSFNEQIGAGNLNKPIVKEQITNFDKASKDLIAVYQNYSNTVDLLKVCITKRLDLFNQAKILVESKVTGVVQEYGSTTVESKKEYFYSTCFSEVEKILSKHCDLTSLPSVKKEFNALGQQLVERLDTKLNPIIGQLTEKSVENVAIDYSTCFKDIGFSQTFIGFAKFINSISNGEELNQYIREQLPAHTEVTLEVTGEKKTIKQVETNATLVPQYIETESFKTFERIFKENLSPNILNHYGDNLIKYSIRELTYVYDPVISKVTKDSLEVLAKEAGKRASKYFEKTAINEKLSVDSLLEAVGKGEVKRKLGKVPVLETTTEESLNWTASGALNTNNRKEKYGEINNVNDLREKDKNIGEAIKTFENSIAWFKNFNLQMRKATEITLEITKDIHLDTKQIDKTANKIKQLNLDKPIEHKETKILDHAVIPVTQDHAYDTQQQKDDVAKMGNGKPLEIKFKFTEKLKMMVRAIGRGLINFKSPLKAYADIKKEAIGKFTSKVLAEGKNNSVGKSI